MITVESVTRDGLAMTAQYRDAIALKFRTEIGGVYNFVAARIEQDHAELERHA